MERAQTGLRALRGSTALMTSDCSGTVLERPAREGESPVGETEKEAEQDPEYHETRETLGE